MATNISAMHAVSPTVDPARQARRSRFSIHFNTPRMRRWLLVQLVTMPNTAAEDGHEAANPITFGPRAERPQPVQKLLDDFTTLLYHRRTA